VQESRCQRRQGFGAEVVWCGKGVSPSRQGLGSMEIFLGNFDVKLATFNAFCVVLFTIYMTKML